MSFFHSSLFGVSEKSQKQYPDVDTVKNALKTYFELRTEPIDYIAGDYVIDKEDAQELGLIKSHLIGFVIKIGPIQDNLALDRATNLTIAIVKDEGEINIIQEDSRLYRKALPSETPSPTLIRFVQDKTILLDPKPGTLVRPRTGLVFKRRDHTKLTSFSGSTSEKIVAPCMVIQSKDWNVTIAGCVETTAQVVEKTVSLYELALY